MIPSTITTMRKIDLRYNRIALGLLVAIGCAFWAPPFAIAASGDVVNCTVPLNISDSPGYTSADPLVIGDPAGGAHLFFAERVLGQPNSFPDVPDTLMYSHYDGQSWSTPIDLFLSPRNVFNRQINAPRGLIDEDGAIHLVWTGPDYRLYYSSAPATEAGSAHAWRPQRLLTRDHSGTEWSSDIAITAPNTLHILYGSGTGGGALDDNRTNRAVTYIRSSDGGSTWSSPVDIYTFGSPANGASNIRLLAGPEGTLYAAWTEWDQSGNGQAIHFTRSLDDGRTWDDPVVLDRRIGDEYERDWANLEVLDRDRLVAMWEGGFRAYPQAQYSQDNGQSWITPIDTFYWLIADNGPVQFVRDSTNRLHAFLMRRIREGFTDRCDIFPNCPAEGSTNGTWHSVWEGDTIWREPRPVNFSSHSYLSAAAMGGNQVVLASFGFSEKEVFVTQCEIEGAPPVAAKPWPAQPRPTAPPPTDDLRQETTTPVAAAAQEPPALTTTGQPTPATATLPVSQTDADLDPEAALVMGLAPVILLVAGVVLLTQMRRLSSH